MTDYSRRQQSARQLLGALHAQLTRQKSLGLTEISAATAQRWASELAQIAVRLDSEAPALESAPTSAAEFPAHVSRSEEQQNPVPRLVPAPIPDTPADSPPRSPVTPMRHDESPASPSQNQAPVSVSTVPAAQDSPPRAAGRRPVERAAVPWARATSPQTSTREATAPTPPAALSLTSVRDVLGDCERCGRCKTRDRILFGTGAPKAALVFVLDPPNADENEQGRILVEAAGELFDSMLQKGMGLSREQVYVTNVLKCYSGTDKLPAREELAACTPFLHDQLRVVAPTAIITMGAAAASGVLAPRFDLQAAHGQWTQWKGIPVMPTFSVAAMIAEPRLKRDVWAALKQVMARLDMQRPDESPS